jgi:hypothetical protein
MFPHGPQCPNLTSPLKKVSSKLTRSPKAAPSNQGESPKVAPLKLAQSPKVALLKPGLNPEVRVFKYSPLAEDSAVELDIGTESRANEAGATRPEA